MASTPSQGEFWAQAFAFADTLIRKLRSAGREDLVGRMTDCHTSELALVCKNCADTKIVTNRCEKRWCPICVPRLARERREALEFWCNTLKQPKHVVLTRRNTERLTRSSVRTFLSSLSKLRRSKFCSNWNSGTWSMEVTNESRGWHLHAHLLVDATWIDSAQLAIRWGKLIGQDYAIIKVKDARKADYLRELMKYVVKSSQLVSWKGELIAEFMDAFTRTRTFGVFGSLVGQRAEWKRLLHEQRHHRNVCRCGCNDYAVIDERIWQLNVSDRQALKTGKLPRQKRHVPPSKTLPLPSHAHLAF